MCLSVPYRVLRTDGETPMPPRKCSPFCANSPEAILSSQY